MRCHSILNSAPTAELEPLCDQGRVLQTDEQDMGLSYDDLAKLGQLRKPGRCGPYRYVCVCVCMRARV